MKLPRRNFLHLAAGAAALPVVSRIAWAQAYPSRPVRLIVPVAPAGASDITARLIAFPADAILILPGLAFAKTMNSGTVLAGTDGFTTRLGADVGAATRPVVDHELLAEPFRQPLTGSYARLQTATRCSWSGATTRPTQRCTTSSTSISSATSRRSQVSVACHSSWWRAGGHRSHRRAGAGLLRQHCRIDSVYQGWQAAPAGGDRYNALGGSAGYSDGWRVRSRLRGQRVAGSRCTQEHAYRIHRETQQCNQRGPC